MLLTAFPAYLHGGVEKASDSHYATSISIDGVAYAVEECHVSQAGAAALRSVVGGSESNSRATGSLRMVLAGASTVGVVEDESLCTNVQRTDLHIKTGGQGKPTLVHCTKTGILPVCLSVQGCTVRMNIPVRIVPGFGVNIFPECFFLQKHFRVQTVRHCHCHLPRQQTSA